MSNTLNNFLSNYPLYSNEYWLEYAIHIAKKGYWTCKPNPAVGCVIVKDNQLLTEGFHQFAGKRHAEIIAIDNFKLGLLGSSQNTDNVQNNNGLCLYVTLEPCCHFCKTPPCVTTIINFKPAKVVVGMVDPNPKVAGQGIDKLRQAGIEVELIKDKNLIAEVHKLNESFMYRMLHDRPQIIVKIASSMDGRTTAPDGTSKWLTNSLAREDVHKLRLKSDVVITGINTVMADDAQLTARLSAHCLETMNMKQDDMIQLQPISVILDSNLSISPTAKILHTSTSLADILIFTAKKSILSKQHKISQLTSNNLIKRCRKVSVIGVDKIHQLSYNRLNLMQIIDYISKHYEVNQIMIEAGARVCGSFLQTALVDKLFIYQSADIMGDGMSNDQFTSKPLADLPCNKSMSDKLRFSLQSVKRFDNNLRIIYQPLST